MLKNKKMNKDKILNDLKLDNTSGYKTRENYIKNNYQEDYDEILKIKHIDCWIEKLYFYLQNISHIPNCIKHNCSNKVKFNRQRKTYYKYCSIVCRNQDVKNRLYGSLNPMKQSNNVLKMKKTKKEKYGDENYNNILKMKKTKKEKYGDENYNNRPKVVETCLNKYGVPYYTNRPKAIETNLKKYGIPYYCDYEKAIKTMVERYGEIWLKHTPKYNPNSIIYLDMLAEKLNLPIQHALNGGEKKFVRYWIDGYIEEHNICIEWDEKHHNSIRQKERDNKKDVYLKENFDCKIIRINEKEFLKNIETGLKNISSLIFKSIK